MDRLNAGLIFAALSPVLLFMSLYTVVVIVALVRADVKDVPGVLEVALKVYERVADQLSKIVARTGGVLRASGVDSRATDAQKVQPHDSDTEGAR